MKSVPIQVKIGHGGVSVDGGATTRHCDDNFVPFASGGVTLAFNLEAANNGKRSISPSRTELPQSVFSLFHPHLDCCRALPHRIRNK